MPPELHDGLVGCGGLGGHRDLNAVEVAHIGDGSPLIGACEMDPHWPTWNGRSGRAARTHGEFIEELAVQPKGQQTVWSTG